MRPLGLWSDSRAVYAIGAFFAGVFGCVVVSALLAGGMGWGLAVFAIVPGGLVGFLLVIAALVGFHMTSGNPHLHPIVRWLALCVFAWIVLGIITVFGVADNLRNGLWSTVPMAVIHGVWTALFLMGRRTPDG